MPFTFAHPAIVLPFGYLSKRWVSLTGLVIGSMTPDFEYFIRMAVASNHSHKWLGVFYFDLPLGMAIFFIYQQIVKNKLTDELPNWFYKRLSFLKTNGHGYTLPYLIIVATSILIGVASHLFWDAFTHQNGYFVNTIPALTNTFTIYHRHIYFYKLAQHASTLLGFGIILFSIYRLPAKPGRHHTVNLNYWLIIAFTTIIFLATRIITGTGLHQYGTMIVTGISGSLIGIIAASLLTPAVKMKAIY